MSKRKYIAPACESIVLTPVSMMATSVYVSNGTTEADAFMSNTNRNYNPGL